MNKFILQITFLLLIAKSYSQDKLFYSTNFPNNIYTSNLDGSDQKLILSEDDADYLFLNLNNNKIYWTDESTNKVFISDRDGKNKRVFIENIIKPRGISISSDNNLIIVSDNKILKYDFNGILIATIVSNLSIPEDILEFEGRLYWTDEFQGKIESCKIDGSDKKTIKSDLNYLYNIEIRSATKEIYIAQSVRGLFKCNLNGSNYVNVIDETCSGICITGNSLYYSNATNNYIGRLDFVDNKKIRVFNNLIAPTVINFDSINNKLVFINYDFGHYIFEGDLSMGQNSFKSLVGTDLYRPSNLNVDYNSKKIYFLNEKSSFINDNYGAIMRCDFDGGNLEQLLKYPNIKRVESLKILPERNIMLWADIDAKRIYKSELDGKNIVEIVSSGLSSPSGIAFSESNERIYWCDWNAKKIQSCTLDGSDIEEVITNSNATSINIGNDKIYFVNLDSSALFSCDLSGNSIKKLYKPDIPSPSLGDFIIDEKNELIILIEGFLNNKLVSIDFNGNNKVAIKSLNNLSGLVYFDNDIVNIKEIPSVLPQYSLNTVFNDEILIESLNNTEIKNVGIFNAQGILLKSYDNLKSNIVNIVELSTLRPGYYLLQINNVFTTKLLKI